MPSSSWVARWNNLEGMKPGIYAITILEDNYEREDLAEKPKQKSKKFHSHDGVYSDDEENFYD
jgi:hypothetical protein